MTNRQVGELAFGVLALYVFFVGLLNVAAILPAIVSGGGRSGVVLLAAVAFVYFAAALYFWLERSRLATRFFPEEGEGVPERVAVIAIGVIGIILLLRLVGALAQFFNALAAGAHPELGLVPLASAFILFGVAGLVAGVFTLGGHIVVRHVLAMNASPGAGASGVAFAAVGLYLMATALPALIAIWMSTRSRFYGRPAPMDWSPVSGSLLQHGLELIAGIAIFFGAGPLARAWRRIRSMPRGD